MTGKSNGRRNGSALLVHLFRDAGARQPQRFGERRGRLARAAGARGNNTRHGCVAAPVERARADGLDSAAGRRPAANVADVPISDLATYR